MMHTWLSSRLVPNIRSLDGQIYSDQNSTRSIRIFTNSWLKSGYLSLLNIIGWHQHDQLFGCKCSLVIIEKRKDEGRCKIVVALEEVIVLRVREDSTG